MLTGERKIVCYKNVNGSHDLIFRTALSDYNVQWIRIKSLRLSVPTKRYLHSPQLLVCPSSVKMFSFSRARADTRLRAGTRREVDSGDRRLSAEHYCTRPANVSSNIKQILILRSITNAILWKNRLYFSEGEDMQPKDEATNFERYKIS